MATIRKRGKSWQAQIRHAECPAKSKSFPTKKAAENGCAIMFERFAQQVIKVGRPIKIVGDPVANG